MNELHRVINYFIYDYPNDLTIRIYLNEITFDSFSGFQMTSQYHKELKDDFLPEEVQIKIGTSWEDYPYFNQYSLRNLYGNSLERIEGVTIDTDSSFFENVDIHPTNRVLRPGGTFPIKDSTAVLPTKIVEKMRTNDITVNTDHLWLSSRFGTTDRDILRHLLQLNYDETTDWDV